MLFIGITGGLACGKTTVARILASKGAEVIGADELGHQAIRRGQPAYDELVKEFGPGILQADGEIDRPAVARLSFGQPDRVRRLNEIVHPAIRRLIAERAKAYAEQHPEGLLILDAALLLEAFGEAHVDKVVLVDCPEEQQVRRFVAKGGSAEQALDRMAAQFSRAERLARADYVIDGSGTIEQTRAQALALWDKLQAARGQI